MKQLLTTGIVLSRTDYGEADRIITVLTPDQGKLRLMAKGVRKVKSKLAGGIELFSISHITFWRGRGEIGTLVSTRLETHYRHIVKDLTRTQAGYDMIKMLNKATEDGPEPEYFELLHGAFAALDDPDIDLNLIRTWFQAQLLKLSGHTPNLRTDTAGKKLEQGQSYQFDYDMMAFMPSSRGSFTSDSIKVLRLLCGYHPPQSLAGINGMQANLERVSALVRTAAQTYLRIA